ncbi:MAG TPA: spermidine/putrescine ABC transporter substrate-binding protein [Ktedonobacterales bacterium]
MAGAHRSDHPDHLANRALDLLESSIINRPMTRRGFLGATAVTGAAAFLAACGVQSATTTQQTLGTTLEGQLHIYNWGSYYLGRDDLSAFKSKFNVTVTEDAYDSNETLLAKIQAGATGYDVCVPTGYMVEIMAQQGLLYKLAHDHIPNFSYVDSQFRNLPFDPGNQYSMPKDWGTTGFGYRSDLLPAMYSWADFFKYATTTASGKTIVLDGVNEVIGSLLKMLGYSYNSVDASQLDQVRQKLLLLKPHLLAITATDDITMMGNGQAILALDWNGNVLAAQANQAKLQYVIPTEGSEFWVDNWSVLKSAPDPIAAHAFINFMLDPTTSAKEISTTYYAQCETAAFKTMDPALANNTVIYPNTAQISRLESQAALSSAGAKLRKQIWDEFKAA